MAEWIGVIIIAPETEKKLRRKHKLTGDKVREAIGLGAADDAAIEDHPRYGERLVVRGRSYDATRIIVYLRPVDRTDGVWECLTARRILED